MAVAEPFAPKRSLRRRIAFVAVFLLLCYALCEFGAWLYLRSHPAPPAAYPVDDQILGIYDPGTAQRVAADLRNRRACFLPYLQIGLVPNQRHSSYTVNSLGLRGKEPTLPKPADTFRIIMLGGSTLWGEWCSSDEATIPARLERALAEKIPGKTVEVFNCGMPGYVSAQEFLLYALYLHAWQPDMVIVFDGFNDMYTYYNTGKVGRTNWMGIFSNAIEQTRLKNNNQYNPWRDTARYYLQKSFLFTALRRNAPEPTPAPRRIDDSPQQLDALAAWYQQNLRSLACLAARDSIRVVAVLQPLLPCSGKKIEPSEQIELDKYDRVYENFKDFTPKAYAALWQALASLDHELPNVTAFNAASWLDSAQGPLFFDLCHLSDAANDLLAQRLAGELAAAGLLPR